MQAEAAEEELRLAIEAGEEEERINELKEIALRERAEAEEAEARAE